MADPRHVVLVHGAWHGAWCWAALQAELDRRGIPSLAVDLPGHGTSPLPAGDLFADIAEVHRVLDRVPGPVVLVGHSYGGAVISGVAAGRDDVGAVVYLAAYALATGESVRSILEAHPGDDTALRAAIEMRADGTSVLRPDAVTDALYGRSPAPAVAAATARLEPQAMVNFTQAVPASVLSPDTPPATSTVYVRCTLDAAVPLEQQDAMAARCARTVTLETDHSPFLSRTDEVADVLAELALANGGAA